MIREHDSPNHRAEAASVREAEEIAVGLSTEPEAQQELMAVLARAGVTLLASRPFQGRSGVKLLLVTAEPKEAKQALDGAGFKCGTASVVLVTGQHWIGLAAQLGACLKTSGVRIEYSYSYEAESKTCYTVFKTRDNGRALCALRDCMWDRATAAPPRRIRPRRDAFSKEEPS